MEIMGIKIPTIITENSGIRCEGCREQIAGTPFRVSVLDIIATEVAPSFEQASPINPGPFQFCKKPECPALSDSASVTDFIRARTSSFRRRPEGA